MIEWIKPMSTPKGKLVVVGGDLEPGEIPLTPPMTFGRGRTVDVKLSHPLVSRQHCRIDLEDDQYVVQDLGSLNGTFVGRERVERAVLAAGDLLTIGTVTFRTVLGEEETESGTSMRAALTDTNKPLELNDTVLEATRRIKPAPTGESVSGTDPRPGPLVSASGNHAQPEAGQDSQ